MRLFIAEKPDLAKAICTGLGGGFSRKDGYMVKGGDIVTWCFGHMLTLKDPKDMDDKYKFWQMDTLPIPPFLPAQRKVPKDKKKQVAIIRDLVKQADTIVNAGDPDDEGQLLIDELLRYFGNNKPVMRVLINDNTPAVVKKALNNLKPNTDFEHLGWKAESRMIADQLFGYNLTRAYSLKEQSVTGDRATLHIGRVQTPILGLVVRRDRLNANHKKAFYYQIIGDFEFSGLNFKAKYQTKDNDPVDDKGRLIDKAFSEKLAQLLTGKSAAILSAGTQHKKEPAPLPYNLLKLQQDASRKFGYKPDETMAITQSLREKHNLITYNRSDCQYLSDEQFADVDNVLAAISDTFAVISGACKKANPSFKGRAFNSSKVSAHHAIIPTITSANWDSLSKKEQNIYKIIARSYIAQFYPLYEYDETKLTIDVMADGQTYQFQATARIDTCLGWKKLYANDKGNEETAVDDDTQDNDLRNLSSGIDGLCNKTVATEHETKPPSLYTMTSLLGDLTRVAKYVKDPKLADILKNKDKDKQGEHGGIGTPATRSSIIQNLFERGYLAEKGKSIVSTDKGKDLYDKLDDLIRYPDMTAIWHEQQQSIKDQEGVNQFINQMQDNTIAPIVNRLKQDYTPPKPKEYETAPCPQCGRDMRRYPSKFKKGDWYWSCTGYSDKENPCKHVMDDNNGQPIEKQPKAAPDGLTDFECKACGSKLIHRTGISKKTKKPYSFFGCSSFPKCKQNYDEKNGKPVKD